MTEKPCLIIPIETKFREYDAKSYLAGIAAQNGFRVLLGEQNTLLRNLASLPAGYYWDKGIARLNVDQFKRLKKLGFRIIAHCEEGLVYRHPRAYLHERVMPEAFQNVDLFFAWGQNQADDIESKIQNSQNKIICAGNARLDLLNDGLRGIYEEEAKRLREEHGDFILINTNFARYNHFYGKEKLLGILKTRGVVSNREEYQFYAGWIDHLGAVYHSFLNMIPAIHKAFPNNKIIIRPHPSERHKPWQEFAKKYENMDVVYEGTAIPWIIASKVVIHNSCTTGVEAALLDKPTIAYCNVVSDIYDSYLPNEVSQKTTTPDELISAIQSILDGQHITPLSQERVSKIMQRYVASYKGEEAAPKMIRALLERIDTIENPTKPFLPRFADLLYQTYKKAGRVVKRLFSSADAYEKQKFSNLECEEIQALLNSLSQSSGKFDNIKVSPFMKNVACIERPDNLKGI